MRHIDTVDCRTGEDRNQINDWNGVEKRYPWVGGWNNCPESM